MDDLHRLRFSRLNPEPAFLHTQMANSFSKHMPYSTIRSIQLARSWHVMPPGQAEGMEKAIRLTAVTMKVFPWKIKV